MNNTRLQRIYFETSALTSFAHTHDVQDAIATKAFQNTRGRGWYISPVVLWEVLLTSDEQQREKLIYFAQHLFEPELLPSPEKLIIRYIRSGCPLVEEEYPLSSTGTFSAAWRDICQIKDKTLIYDPEQIARKTRVLRDIARLLHEFFKFGAIDISAKPGVAGLQVSVQQLLEGFNIIPHDLKHNQDALRHFRLVAFYILLLLCAGASIEGHVIEEFWNEKQINRIEDRIEFVFSTHPELVFRGPFQQIALMTEFQSATKFSRGVYFDSLHTVYSVYADLLLSADEHFRTFRDKLKEEFSFMGKIRHLDEIQFIYTERQNQQVETFL
jgi:hypothetical protein